MKQRKARPFVFLPGKMLAAALALFTLTLSSTIVGTYAWFNVRDFARIEKISMGFSGGGNLRIGLKDKDGVIRYKAGINESDLREADPNYEVNADLKDVSSMFGSVWQSDATIPANQKKPILRKSYTSSSLNTMTEAATEHFLQFETFFRCDEPCHLYLDHTTKAKPLERWNKERAAQSNYSEEELNRVLDSVRVSFYSEETFIITEPNQDEASHTQYGGPLWARNWEGYYDYDNGKEILFGEYTGTPTYSEASPTDTPKPDNASSFNAYHKAGVEIVNPDSVTYATEESYPLDSILFQGGATAGNAHCLGTLKANEDYRLVISIYIEGWDRDLTDALATGKFSLDLRFIGLLDI